MEERHRIFNKVIAILTLLAAIVVGFVNHFDATRPGDLPSSTPPNLSSNTPPIEVPVVKQKPSEAHVSKRQFTTLKTPRTKYQPSGAQAPEPQSTPPIPVA